MFKRQTEGSVLCIGCGRLVGVGDEKCYNCGRWNPSLWGYAGQIRKLGADLGFVQVILVSCIVLYLSTLLIDMHGIRMGGLMLMAPSRQALILFGASGGLPVFGLGYWWTLLSAGWLHGGLIHIGFNMMWVRSLAPLTAESYGPGRMIIIYTLSSVVGFAASSFYAVFRFGPATGQITIGASAAIMGLLGALVLYGRRGGSSVVGRQAWTYAVILFLFGLFWDGVDNAAHFGGFIGGYLTAMLLDPMKEETGDHLVIALLCLVATALAVIRTFFNVLPILLQLAANQ